MTKYCLEYRLLWMTLKNGDGKLSLPKPEAWMIDLKTGETEVMADKP